MALQGTLDTFALADLVRLLATTSKTGELAIDGDRGPGRLWFADGQLIGGEPAADDLVDVVFALLRAQDGDFAFHADVRPDDARDPQSALDVLATAEARLEEWRPIEELVPSPAVALTLREELPGDEVTIGRDLWRRLVAVGGGTAAGAFGAALDLDEHATGYAIRDMVEAGLVEVGDEVAEPVEPTEDVTPVASIPESAPVVIVAPVVEIAPELVPESAPAPAPDPRVAPAAAADPVVEPLGPPDEPVVVPPVLGVVPDPPYSFGRWGEGPVPAPDEQVEPAALGPWEPLTPPMDVTPDVGDEVLPSLDAVPALETQPLLDPVGPADAPTIDTVEPLRPYGSPAGPLPSLDAPTPAPSPADPIDPGSYAVDLDSQLGGPVSGHSYLGTADGGAALPEPLLRDDVPLAAAPEAALPEAPPAEDQDELAARRDRADEDVRAAQRTRSEELGVPLDSLSPAAARALAAAASADDDGDDTDAGRRVLRRIISTGKG
ncbi:MAG TPA: DUF4388 domain-containing protein [Iamia sp.]|nr:DUF4388 domain-containing protein [Iamia sp.]